MSAQSHRARALCVAGVLVMSWACRSDTNQVAPTSLPPQSPQPPPSPTPPASPAGTATVIEFTMSGTQRPVPNLRLKVRAGSRLDGAVGGVELPDIITDANGRYPLSALSNGIVFLQTAPGSEYRFLCDAYPVVMLRSFTLTERLYDLPVVHISWSGDRLPPGMWIPGTSVHGTVTQRLGDRLEPVPGATVTFDSGLQDPPGTTSATGFYMVCSTVGTDQYRTMTVRKEGYQTLTRQIFGGWDYRVDFELVPD